MDDATFRCVRCGNPYKISLGASGYLQAELILPEELQARSALRDDAAAEQARLRPLLERLLARMEQRDLGEPCSAVLHHGPGHQSRTTCEIRGEHVVHRATFGRYDQEATWIGSQATTGYLDEAPETDVEEPSREDLLLADLRRELGKVKHGDPQKGDQSE